MTNHISPAAQLFRGMAALIDHDHTSQTHYDAITKAAEALAACAATQQLVAAPLWQADGARLLAAAYAFHAGLSRQAVTVTHVRALVPSGPVPSDRGDQAPAGKPIASSAGDAAGQAAWSVPPASARVAAVESWRVLPAAKASHSRGRARPRTRTPAAGTKTPAQPSGPAAGGGQGARGWDGWAAAREVGLWGPWAR